MNGMIFRGKNETMAFLKTNQAAYNDQNWRKNSWKNVSKLWYVWIPSMGNADQIMINLKNNLRDFSHGENEEKNIILRYFVNSGLFCI